MDLMGSTTHPHQSLTDDSIMLKQFELELSLHLPLDWSSTPKSELEIIAEQSSPKEKAVLLKIEEHPIYRYLIPLDIDDAGNKVLNITTKRYMMLRKTLLDENKAILDQILKKQLESQQHKETELDNKLKTILNKEKIAAYHHIKNSYSSIGMAVFLSQKPGNLGIKMLCAGLLELYSGDQRFFKEQIQTRAEIAKKGGIARKDRYLETKREACRQLDELTPPKGWTTELDAYKAILPKIKKHMKDNDTRYPAQNTIENTLRRWIKNDSIVSAAVRIAQS
jgi:hypothetical protein